MPIESGSSSSGRSSRASHVVPPPAGDSTRIVGRSADASDATVLSNRAPSIQTVQPSVQEIGRALENTSLGVYELERFVGGGGMGAVFRARDTTLDRTVAVKVLFAQSAADEELVRRFRNEAQSAARLNHDNIGRVHAVGYEDGWHFIVFEYIEGRNLREIVADSGPFTVGRTVDVAVQIAAALGHASERDVVHRDIKPSNIIITPQGQAKLVDMGLARLHQVAGVDDLTVSGMTLGTFDYISPEQARDPRDADVRSDLYSLGCTLYFLLAGRPPFSEGTMVQKLLQHQQAAAQPIEELRPDVPKKLAGAIAKLMEKSPADRYQHPSELVADLASLADDYGLPVSMPKLLPSADAGSPRWTEQLPWVVPLVGLAVVVASLFWRTSANVGRDGASADPLPAVSQPAASPPARPEPDALPEAIAAAKDGDVIELAFSGERSVRPFDVVGKRIVIRAAPDHSPTLRLASAASAPQGVVRVASASLSMQGVGVLWEPAAVGGMPARLFVLGDAGNLDLRGCSIGVAKGVEQSSVASEPPVLVDVAAAEPPMAVNGQRTIRMDRTRISGDAVVMRSVGAGASDVGVNDCRVATARRFILLEGDAVVGGAVRLSLERSSFECGEGFACLLDSPARPALPRLFSVSRESRFVTPDGASLLEQSGIGDPEQYLAAVEWIDIASRYEGSDVFRRIDGAAERIELEFAASAVPMEHSRSIGRNPEEAIAEPAEIR